MKRIALLLSIAAATASFGAAPIKVSGRGEAPYKNIIGKPTIEVELQARREAIYNAIDRALENQSEALREQYKKASQDITVQDYEEKRVVTESRKTDSLVDPRERKVTAFFEGTLDLTALRDMLNAMPTQPAGAGAAGSVALSVAEVAVFFTVRETSENIVQVVGESVSTSSAKNKEAEASQTASENGVVTSETSLRQGKDTISITQSQKSDVQKYKLDAPSREIFGTGLLARLSAKGFNQILDGAMMESSADLDQAFGSGDAVPAKIWKKVSTEVREIEPTIKYLVVGTIDFSIPTKDSLTGQAQYNGTVSGKVYQLSGAGLPRIVAALEPQEQKFSAGTQQDAKKRVIAKLSEQAADDIITKLRNKDGL